MPLAQDDPPAGIPEWVVTFGDMMSLLLTFFIMLVSLSEMKQEEKFQAMMESMRRQFGHEMTTNSLVPGHMRPRNSSMAALANMGRAKRLDTMQGGDKTKAPTGDYPQVRIVRPGTRTTIGTVLIFDELAVELTAQQKEDLTTLADALAGKPQKVEVRGHATGRRLPPGSPYADAWALSYARAKAVADFLASDLKIEPLRIRITAAGSHEPYTLEASADAQRLNPRVEVFLLEEVVRDVVGLPGQIDATLLPPSGGAPPSG